MVRLSKTFWGIFQFRFRFVLIKVYFRSLKRKDTLTLKRHTVEPLLTVTSIHRSPPDKRPEKKVPAELMVKLL